MPLVIDCVPFFNEQELWDLRYETLRGVVDTFVIVEARHTHSGCEKPLTFTAPPDAPVRTWAASLPDPGMPGIPATRRREMTQRNAIAEAVGSLSFKTPDDVWYRDCRDDDILLISDCDEIPNPAVVAELAAHGLPDGHIVVFRQKLCYYDLNTSGGYVWQGTRAARWGDVRALSPHIVRYGIASADPHYPLHLLAMPGGWHLSYFGGADAVRAKMGAFLHQELVTPEALGAVEARVAAGEDAYGRGDIPFQRGPTDDVPPPVLADPARWRHLYHPEHAP
jgi:hypothetical protein